MGAIVGTGRETTFLGIARPFASFPISTIVDSGTALMSLPCSAISARMREFSARALVARASVDATRGRSSDTSRDSESRWSCSDDNSCCLRWRERRALSRLLCIRLCRRSSALPSSTSLGFADVVDCSCEGVGVGAGVGADASGAGALSRLPLFFSAANTADAAIDGCCCCCCSCSSRWG